MKAVILVPWRGGDPHREKNWHRVRAWYETMGLPIITGDSDPGQPFNRSVARNRAAELAGEWDVAAFIDADSLIGEADLMRGFHTAHALGHLVLPFTRYWLCDRRDRPRVCRTFHPGAVVVIPRGLWDDLGGYDERFAGWGGEDSAMAWAATTFGCFRETDGDVWHLWHPRPRITEPENYIDAHTLGLFLKTSPIPQPFPLLAVRYYDALFDPAAMSAVLAERDAHRLLTAVRASVTA